MSTPNQPVVRVLWDSDFVVTLEITGLYLAGQPATNTKIFQANSCHGANTSKLCLVDVVAIQYAVSTANGFLSLEYAAANVNNNVTIASFGRSGVSGNFNGPMNNPQVNPATGDINLFTSAMDANDVYSMMLTIRKNNFNGAFDNVLASYS